MRWHILRDADGVTVSRQPQARFDFAVTARLECAQPVARGRLAQHVRQDLWRALQDLRGFSPAVRVRNVPGGVEVVAGGALAGAPLTTAGRATVEQLLTDPQRRRRWLAHAMREGVRDA